MKYLTWDSTSIDDNGEEHKTYRLHIPASAPIDWCGRYGKSGFVTLDLPLGRFDVTVFKDALWNPDPPLDGHYVYFSATELIQVRAGNKYAMLTGAKLFEIIRYDPAKPTMPEHKKKDVSLHIPEALLSSFKQVLADVKVEGAYLPMPHQYEAAYFKVFSSAGGRAFDLSTMRTGKTGSTMLAMEYLLRTGAAKHVMVLAPLSCVRPVWADALRLTLPQRITGAVVGTRTQRKKIFAEGAEILCSNFESVALFPDEWREFKPDLIVVDECTHYANNASKRYKAFVQFVSDVKPAFVWGLTGTPGHDPLKAFCMSKAINPNAVQCDTLRGWQSLTQYRFGPQAWQWRNNDDAPKLIKEALSPAVLFKKDDLFSLPPVAYIAREAEPSAQQKKLMDTLRNDMIAVADSGEVITAQQKSALVSKLLQCACGAVYDDNHEPIYLDTKAKVDEIEALIEEATGKTVIFSAFTGCISGLRDALKARGHKVAVVDGSTSEKLRSDVFRRFQYDPMGESIDVLIAHPRTTAFGIELSAADMMIFDGAPLSGDFVFGQAVERLSSTKQRAEQITIAQVYCSYEERKVFKALRDGQSESAIVADLFKNVTQH